MAKIKTKSERLLSGETFITKEPGNSMHPLIKSGQPHQLSPVTWQQLQIGDIVYCRVRGKYYTHLVKSTNAQRGVRIGNNRGGINGWTKQVFGKVTKVLPMPGE